jgi:hypothetical protein
MIWAYLHHLWSYKNINSVSNLYPLIFFCLDWKQKEVHMFLLGKIKHIVCPKKKKSCTFSLLTFKKWKEMVEADTRIIQNAIFDPRSKQQIQSYYIDLVHFFCIPSFSYFSSYFFLLLSTSFRFLYCIENLSLVFEQFISLDPFCEFSRWCCYNFKKLFACT